MKIEEFKSDRGRVVLSHMATSSVVLSRVSARWEERGLFGSYWENLVAGWCVDYYRKYGKAPRRGLRAIFKDYAESSLDKDTPLLVDKFLQHLSDEHAQSDKLTTEHVIDIAGNHFNRVKIEKTCEEAMAFVEANQITKADSLMAKYSKVELGAGSYVELMTDKETFLAAFEESSESLVDYPGALGGFFRYTFERNSFVSIQASEKSGKSWMLQDIAVTAIEQRRKVAFFAIGDLSQAQMIERFAVRFAKHPTLTPNGKWPCVLKVPLAIARPKSGEEFPEVTYEQREFKHPLDPAKGWEAVERVLSKKIKSRNSPIRLSCHPNDSISMLGIRDILTTWATQGWVCDLVVIDYSDILAPMPGFKEERDQINANWKKMRALAQELHCCVVTATQADAKSYEKRTQDKRNFTGDKRKNAHASAIFAINASDAERTRGIMRLNFTVKRKGAYNSTRCLYVAGCLGIASPCLVSTF